MNLHVQRQTKACLYRGPDENSNLSFVPVFSLWKIKKQNKNVDLRKKQTQIHMDIYM